MHLRVLFVSRTIPFGGKEYDFFPVRTSKKIQGFKKKSQTIVNNPLSDQFIYLPVVLLIDMILVVRFHTVLDYQSVQLFPSLC